MDIQYDDNNQNAVRGQLVQGNCAGVSKPEPLARALTTNQNSTTVDIYSKYDLSNLSCMPCPIGDDEDL